MQRQNFLIARKKRHSSRRCFKLIYSYERIGKFQNAQWVGYGVVAVLKNGPGPTVFGELNSTHFLLKRRRVFVRVRCKTKNDAGLEVSVMHAYGHDIHMTSFWAAKLLTELKTAGAER